jgi:ribosomal protein S18 acetylase RimI-like enzyme
MSSNSQIRPHWPPPFRCHQDGLGTAARKTSSAVQKTAGPARPNQGSSAGGANYMVLPPTGLGPGRQRIRAIVKGSTQTVGSVDIERVASGRLYISNLSVEPQHRRQGIATQLMSAAVRSAQNHNSSRIVLEARPGAGGIQAPSLISMYQKLGFRSVGKSRRGNPLMERNTGASQR